MTFVSLSYWPDQAAVPRLMTDLAEDCASAGGDVTVLTSRTQYVQFSDARLPHRQRRNGVEIRRLWATRIGRGTRIGRMVDYASFLASVFLRLLVGPGKGTIVCGSLPPMLAVSVAAAAAIRRRPFLYKVDDLFPDLAIRLGVLRTGVLTRLLQALSRFALRRAEAVIAIDPRMRDELQRQDAGLRVEVIPNWCDGDWIRPDPAAGALFRASQGAGDRFLVLYSGNLGLCHEFDGVIEAARAAEARGPGRFLFLFIGTGPRRRSAELSAQGLQSVRFIDFLPPEQVPASHSAADLILITLRPGLEGLVVPSKFYTAIAAGKPVLYVSGGNDGIADVIRKERLGWTSSSNASEILACLETARSDAAELSERGRRARELFLASFERRRATARWVGLLAADASGSEQPERALG